MAEQGFFARELNTGWAEWSEGGLPTHADPQLAGGSTRCACSLDAELLGGDRPAAPQGPAPAP